MNEDPIFSSNIFSYSTIDWNDLRSNSTSTLIDICNALKITVKRPIIKAKLINSICNHFRKIENKFAPNLDLFPAYHLLYDGYNLVNNQMPDKPFDCYCFTLSKPVYTIDENILQSNDQDNSKENNSFYGAKKTGSLKIEMIDKNSNIEKNSQIEKNNTNNQQIKKTIVIKKRDRNNKANLTITKTVNQNPSPQQNKTFDLTKIPKPDNIVINYEFSVPKTSSQKNPRKNENKPTINFSIQNKPSFQEISKDTNAQNTHLQLLPKENGLNSNQVKKLVDEETESSKNNIDSSLASKDVINKNLKPSFSPQEVNENHKKQQSKISLQKIENFVSHKTNHENESLNGSLQNDLAKPKESLSENQICKNTENENKNQNASIETNVEKKQEEKNTGQATTSQNSKPKKVEKTSKGNYKYHRINKFFQNNHQNQYKKKKPSVKKEENQNDKSKEEDSIPINETEINEYEEIKEEVKSTSKRSKRNRMRRSSYFLGYSLYKQKMFFTSLFFVICLILFVLMFFENGLTPIIPLRL